MKRLRHLLLALPVPLVLFAVDLAVRADGLAKLPPDFKAYYASSLTFVWLVWYAALAALHRLQDRSRALGWAAASLMASLFVATVFGTYAFFAYFHALPNVFVFEFLFDEPHNAWIYGRSALHPGYAAALLAAAGSFAAYLTYAARRPYIAAGRRDLAVDGVLLCLFCGFFHNNVRMGPNAFTADVHAVFSFTKAAERAVTGQEDVQVVSAGARAPVGADLGKLPHNVLLILNESLRAKSLSAYGYFRDTSPNLREFFARRAGNVVRFDRAYANATRTMLAFPSFFTGVVPSQSGALLHHVPLIYDYARAFTDASTFLISSQSMHWGNFDRFLDVGRLDYAFYKETSEHAEVGRDRFESLDDKYVPEAFAKFLKGRDKGKKFFGVIQLTNTHAPYLFDKADDLWHDSRLTNSYDNSIHYHDGNTGRILRLLEEQGLLGDTLIVSTSDHGEAFGEHGYYGHLNTFYDEEARVPLWIHLPDRLAKDAKVAAGLRANAKQTVSNADIVPTVLALTAPAQLGKLAQHLSELTGAPLDRALPEHHSVLMQNYNDVDERTMFVGLGLTMGKYKYLLKFNQAVGEEELYDLDADPKEQHNIWDTASAELKSAVIWHVQKYKNSHELYRKAFPDKNRHS